MKVHKFDRNANVSYHTLMREAFEAQIAMFPAMSNPDVRKAIRHYQDIASGWKLSGAGGGGYLVLVSEQPIANAIQLKIRRSGH